MEYKNVYRLVGLLLSVTVLAVVGLIFYMGAFRELIREQQPYFTISPTKAAVQAGQPVKLKGLDWEIGTITKVTLLQPSRQVRIDFDLDLQYADMVGENSLVYIDTGILSILSSGITISPRSFDSPILSAGRIIPAINSPEGMAIARSARYVDEGAGEIEAIIRNVDKLLSTLTADDSPLFQTLENVEAITRQVRYGEGVVPTLINSDMFVNRINGLIDGLDGILLEVNGIVKKQGENVDYIMKNDVRQITSRIDRTIAMLEEQSSEIITDVKGVVSTAANTAEELLLEANERVEILLDEITSQTVVAINDVMMLVRTLLRDVALNADPMLKMLINRVANAANEVIDVGTGTVLQIAQDFRDISGRLRMMTREGQDLLYDAGIEVRKITVGVANTLDSVDSLLQQVANSPLLGGGSGSGASAASRVRPAPPTTGS